MAQRCGNCYGTGILDGKRCHCQGPAKRWFPPKAKKKTVDTLPSGHKHGNDKFLYETAQSIWFECKCGHAHKIAA